MTIRRTLLAAIIAIGIAATLVSASCSFFNRGGSDTTTMVIMLLPGDYMPKASPNPEALGMKIEARFEAGSYTITWKVEDGKHRVLSAEAYDTKGRRTPVPPEGDKPLAITEGTMVYLYVQTL